jgi:hypothetical protein
MAGLYTYVMDISSLNIGPKQPPTPSSPARRGG